MRRLFLFWAFWFWVAMDGSKAEDQRPMPTSPNPSLTLAEATIPAEVAAAGML